LETGSIPYPAFAFSGMSIWYLFTNIVQTGGNSLIESQDIMKKIYFPKLILPISKMLLSVLESSVSFGLLILVMVFFGIDFHLKILLFPVVIAMVIVLGLCLSIWLSALSIKRRDLQHFLPYVINTGIWLTPVFYPVSLIPEPYKDWLYYLNPVATILTFFRAILFDLPFHWEYCISFIFIFILLVAGILYFKRVERNVADFV
jgi:lipopolysaccharide transport system permease protein